jgi:cytochrome c oxidase subunit 4
MTSHVTDDPVAGTPEESAVDRHRRVREHEHPTDRQYVVIALILGAITAAEVSTYFFVDNPYHPLNVGALGVMMIAKFAIVCGYFMHLKFDNPLFRRIFVFGLVLAVVVYLVMLTTFLFFSDDYFQFLRDAG